MTTVPTFIVGHMSGENWDPAWRAGREPVHGRLVRRTGRPGTSRADRPLRRASRRRRLADHQRGADLRRGGPRAEVAALGGADGQCGACRRRHASRSSVGDGAWGIETTGHDNGFSLADLAPFIDFVGPHVYRMETDRDPPAPEGGVHLRAGGHDRPAGGDGGVRAVQRLRVRQPTPAIYYRQLLHNTLLAGRDRLDRLEQHRLRRPRRAAAVRAPSLRAALRHHRLRRRAQAAAARAERASRTTLAAIDLPRLERADASAALVLPSYLAADYPFTQEAERAADRRGPRSRPTSPRTRRICRSAWSASGGRRPAGGVCALPAAVDQAAHRPVLAAAAGAGRGRRHRLRLLLRGRNRSAARSVVDQHRGDFRRRTAAGLRAEQSDRG